jgi:hypothetical protein
LHDGTSRPVEGLLPFVYTCGKLCGCTWLTLRCTLLHVMLLCIFLCVSHNCGQVRVIHVILGMYWNFVLWFVPIHSHMMFMAFNWFGPIYDINWCLSPHCVAKFYVSKI